MYRKSYRRSYKRYRKSYGGIRPRCKANPIVYLFLVLIFLKFVLKYMWLLISLAICFMIYKTYSKHARLQAYRNSGIDEIDRMDGINFENTLALLFRDLGYKVTQTPASGDFGADLILKKHHEKIIVQAKRYNKPVGVRAVQEAIGALGYYNAQEAWVVSNQSYTSQAKRLALMNNVKLYDRNRLIYMLNKRHRIPEKNPW